MKDFQPFDKTRLLDMISGIDIKLEDNLVVTKYHGVLKAVTKVSKRYEIFDIKSFLHDKIEQICSNFDIHWYRLIVKRGVQYLTLASDPVEVGGINFYKCFYILNSSDKTRRLSFNMGIHQRDSKFYFIRQMNNLSLYRKHLTGITQKAEEVSIGFGGETFDQQINDLKSLIGEKVMLSNIRDIILDDDTLKINHMKFDAFKNLLTWNYNLTDSQKQTLRCPSEELVINSSNDFSMDAFDVFGFYMQIFHSQDSHIVQKETERIFKITQCFIRHEKLSEILLGV